MKYFHFSEKWNINTSDICYTRLNNGKNCNLFFFRVSFCDFLKFNAGIKFNTRQR